MRPHIISYEIKYPENVTIQFNDNLRKIVVEGPKGRLERTIDYPSINVKVDEYNKKIIIYALFPTRRDKSRINTWKKHIYNMIRGVTEGFRYKLKAVYVHFPFKMTIKGRTFIIDNFLGEKSPRTLEIPEGVDVKINGEEIIVESIDIERAGNVAGMLEQLTRVHRKDIRKFQDGLYIVEKPYYKYS